ncbi:hypothetical protein ACFOW6_02690 [Fodinicurvata halophila]|uniref:Uncharacterized protein n=1 Tax=Fodinicurvata halophila TaxID=1419723 RepID=A0ABV8UIF9_9PROT
MSHEADEDQSDTARKAAWCGFEEILGAGLATTMTLHAPFFWAPPVWVIALMQPGGK